MTSDTAIQLQKEMNKAWDELQTATLSFNFKKRVYINYCTQNNVKGIYEER